MWQPVDKIENFILKSENPRWAGFPEEKIGELTLPVKEAHVI